MPISRTDLTEANGYILEEQGSTVIQDFLANSAVERFARREAMASRTKSVPRFVGDAPVVVAEGAEIPASAPTLDEIVLTAKKYAQLMHNFALPCCQSASCHGGASFFSRSRIIRRRTASPESASCPSKTSAIRSFAKSWPRKPWPARKSSVDSSPSAAGRSPSPRCHVTSASSASPASPIPRETLATPSPTPPPTTRRWRSSSGCCRSCSPRRKACRSSWSPVRSSRERSRWQRRSINWSGPMSRGPSPAMIRCSSSAAPPRGESAS